MLKSALSLLLAVSVFLFSGCYEVVSLSRDDYKSVNQYDEVNVLTDTAGVVTKYRFSRGMCVVQKDTLVGTGTRMSSFGEEHGVNVELPVSGISVIEVKKLDLAQTFIVAAAAVAVTLGILFVAGPPGASGPSGQSGQPNTL